MFISAKSACAVNKYYRFIILLGTVSLFADVTYEGARSVLGPYLALLGASGAVVGTAVGFAEFIGYGLRLITGFITEKTHKFWLITYVGYALNLLAVPLLAFAGSWEVAIILIMLERFGKAVRIPARDAMLSYASKNVGRGWGFGIHQAFDRLGALVGPLMMALILFFKESYALGFLILAIPAVIALLFLTLARASFPHPETLEVESSTLKPRGLSLVFWLYLGAVGLVGCGYADFALVAYHFQKASIIPAIWVPLFYTIASGTNGIAALITGRLFDRFGISLLVFTTFFAAFFAPLVFFGHFILALIGMILWGIGLGVQESVMRAAVATFVSPERRPSAYGILHFVYGLLWFIGSAIMGFLYDRSPLHLVLFSVITQLLSIPIFLIVIKIRK